MTPEQDKVRQFHTAFDLLINGKPTAIDLKAMTLRYHLIDEELSEFLDAMSKQDLVAVADALGDLLYVVYGAAVSYGIDLEPVFNEIHRSNMSKIGGHKNEAGKWVKPASYSPANLRPILKAMGLEIHDERESNP